MSTPPSPGKFRQPSGTATGLKLRLSDLAVCLESHSEELQVDKTDLDRLKATGEGVVLDGQAEDLRRFFSADIGRLEEEFKLQVNLQRAEGVRIHQAVNQLKIEKTSVHQQLLAIQRRIEAMEEEIGHE